MSSTVAAVPDHWIEEAYANSVGITLLQNTDVIESRGVPSWRSRTNAVTVPRSS